MEILQQYHHAGYKLKLLSGLFSKCFGSTGATLWPLLGIIKEGRRAIFIPLQIFSTSTSLPGYKFGWCWDEFPVVHVHFVVTTGKYEWNLTCTMLTFLSCYKSIIRNTPIQSNFTFKFFLLLSHPLTLSHLHPVCCTPLSSV